MLRQEEIEKEKEKKDKINNFLNKQFNTLNLQQQEKKQQEEAEKKAMADIAAKWDF